MSKYVKSQDIRNNIGKLIEQGIPERQAIKQVMKGDGNAARTVKTWKEQGIYPFGDIDAPARTLDSEVDDNVDTMNDTQKQQQEQLIRDIVRQELATERQSNSDSVQCLAMRPRFRRNMDNTIPKTFRCSKELWSRAELKARKDPATGGNLNGLIEILLFQYLGSPSDLLKE